MKRSTILGCVLGASVLGLCTTMFVASGCFTDATLPCESDSDCFQSQYCRAGECRPRTADADEPDADVARRDIDAETSVRDSDAEDGDAESDGDGGDTCTPTEEMCNGRDDDCDGETDEPKQCSTTGVCDGGMVRCSGGSYESCESTYGGSYESDETTVDGKDNDCDGVTDDVFKRVVFDSSGLFCALKKDRSIYCWGSKTSATGASFPITGDKFKDLAVGSRFLCGLDSGGDAHCWGETLARDKVEVPKNAGPFEDISGNKSTVCGVLANKSKVVCWGRPDPPNDYQQPVASISISGDGYCGLIQADRVRCWNTSQAASELTNEPTRGPYLALDVGGRWACALRNVTGKPDCWGSGDLPDRPSDSDFQDVAVGAPSGNFYACGIDKEDQTLNCWGYFLSVKYKPPSGTYRQLDIGGSGKGCAVATDDTIDCWGIAPEPG